MTRISYPPPFQDIATLARHICASKSTIKSWVKQGKFPAPRKQGGKRIWRWEDVERHLAGQLAREQGEVVDLVERIKHGTRKALAGQ